jgi:hypothetical protein
MPSTIDYMMHMMMPLHTPVRAMRVVGIHVRKVCV